MSRRGAARGRAWPAATAALLLAASFVFGFVAGRSGRPSGDRPSGVVDEAARRIRSQAARGLSQEQLDRAAIRGMVAALGDPHATYYAAEEFGQYQRLLDGRYTGVGLWLRPRGGRGAVVASLLPGSPVAVADLRVGDEIISVDGVPVAGRPMAEIVRQMHRRSGTKVRIGVRRGGRSATVVLRCSDLSGADVTVDRPAPGIGRIRVAAFTGGVGRQVATELRRLRSDGVAGVLLDLRGNPGGLLPEAVEVASAFLDGGPVVSYAPRGLAPQMHQATRGGDTTTALVVLVDGGTASAAEVVAGALQDRHRAVVAGSRTYGKGSVQESYPLSDGSAVEVTIAHYRTPSGRSLEGVGIQPDVAVVSSRSGDRALRRGVALVRGLVGDVGLRPAG